MRALVTGAAGYIGSHVAHALARAGHQVIAVDDLSNGHADALPPGAELHRADVTLPGVLDEIVEQRRAEAILHFAARIQVGESVARPELYYATNVGGMLRVAETASKRRLPVVFSSTAAVYGEPERVPIPVDHPCRPANPYGASKRMSEQVLLDSAQAHRFSAVALRYFNAAGADVDAGLAERHQPETHLIPLALAASDEHGPALGVFGDDWPTPDGTCLRDYVHVLDLAEAHLRALDYLVRGGAPTVLNLGGGRGTSVREVLLAVERVTGKKVRHEVKPRRPGDVASLVADIAPAQATLGWTPSRSSIERIVGDAARSRR